MTDQINGDVVKEKIEKVLKGVVKYKGVQPKILKFLNQKEWHYFPHIPSGKGNIIDVYNSIEKMQGIKNTYFVSSTLAFECVGNSVAYSCRVMRDNFR